MKKLVFLIFILFLNCTPSVEDTLQGKWQAKWTTDPAGYGELAAELEFEMDGSFEFVKDRLTISAFGYKGCVFGTDTLEHTLTWKISGDTLEVQNTPGEPGIQYKILEQTDSKIKLQLVEDIFITLSDKKEKSSGVFAWIAVLMGIGILGILVFYKVKSR